MIESILSRASTILSGAAGIAVVLMLVQVTANVILRYSINEPIVGTIAITSAYYMPAAIFLPLAAIERERGHIIVELFTQKLGSRWTAGLDSFASALGMLYAGCLTWSSCLVAILETSRLEARDVTFFELPVWPTRWFLPLSCFFMMLYMGFHCYKYARSTIAGSSR